LQAREEAKTQYVYREEEEEEEEEKIKSTETKRTTRIIEFH
jgi:hypothetical protein